MTHHFSDLNLNDKNSASSYYGHRSLTLPLLGTTKKSIIFSYLALMMIQTTGLAIDHRQ